MSTNVSAPLLQLIRQQSGDTVKGEFKAGDNVGGSFKRARAKNVTWATPGRMHQVCLFAVEDAPALLGLVSQDLLEAKKVKMLRASSTIDVHPGSGSLATKRAKLDMAAVLAMDAQLHWKCPDRFLYNPSWLVAASIDSSEVPAQQHREVRVLEAFYPRISAIPASPIEPPKAEPEMDNSNTMQIPLISCEDEEDTKSGGVRPIFSDSISSRTSAELAPQINSDPDVAAAAAAAFAVLKAQEKGALIDRDLLIKILSNPLLTECLKNSNISLSNVSNLIPDNRNSGVVENGKGRGQLSSQTMTQGRGTHAPSKKKSVTQWQQGHPMWQPLGFNVGVNTSLSHGRGLHATGSYEQEKGILGNGKGAFGFNTFMEQLCQDASKKLFPHSHVRCIPTSGTLRQSPFLYEGMAARNIVGWNCQPSLDCNLSAPFPRKTAAFRERMPANIKIRRPCLFFNTPKGCRNGIQCNFLHELPQVEPSLIEKTDPPNATQELRTTKGDEKSLE